MIYEGFLNISSSEGDIISEGQKGTKLMVTWSLVKKIAEWFLIDDNVLDDPSAWVF